MIHSTDFSANQAAENLMNDTSLIDQQQAGIIQASNTSQPTPEEKAELNALIEEVLNTGASYVTIAEKKQQKTKKNCRQPSPSSATLAHSARAHCESARKPGKDQGRGRVSAAMEHPRSRHFIR